MYDLLVPKTSTIADLIAELKRKANLDDETAAGVKIYSCQSNKITKELPPDYPTQTVPEYAAILAERTPKEDLEPAEGERSILAFHFDKEPAKTHGIPFKFHLKPVSPHTGPHYWP